MTNDSYVTAYEVNITQHRIYNWWRPT